MSRLYTRRRFLRGAGLGAAAVVINPILSLRKVAGAATGNPGKFLVIVNMLGGNDGLDTVVPSHLQPYIDARPQTNLVQHLPAGESLLDLSGGFQLHWGLKNVKQLWDDGDVHVVNKVSYPDPNQSHFTSQDIMSFGIRNEGDGDGRGWLGRFADLYCADPVEPLGVISVGLGRRPDFQSQVTTPLSLQSVEGFTVDSSEDAYAGEHDLRLNVIRNVLQSEGAPGAEPQLTLFKANKDEYDLVERVQQGTAGWTDPGTYPNTTLGRYLRTVSQLLHGRADFGTKVFYTGVGGFDTHADQAGQHGSLMAQIDGALGAFAADLKSPVKNIWNDCVIVVISEFGRRVAENGSLGTDHGWGAPFLVLGGGVKGSQDAGGGMTEALVEADLAGQANVPFKVDFRDVYGSVIERHLGVEAPALFPDPNYTPDFKSLDLVV
ncbi:MAG TPA: DUF1501 domain-containing protein [Planctomycetota bacterium]|nr:DUF1501 domain-containing protein [Planctomycetota bacterium]